tara:strand:- start:7505 stop:7702 length:198 start_codon:yes stop_codon:yes gene_type:complete
MKILDFICSWILITAALALVIGLSIDPAVQAYPEYSQEINLIWTEEAAPLIFLAGMFATAMVTRT